MKTVLEGEWSPRKRAWMERAATVFFALVLVAVTGLVLALSSLGHGSQKPCTVADVNAGVERCDPRVPPELPYGVD